VASYILVDLENIPQPKLPEPLPEDVLVWVFAGHNQTKIPLDLVEKLHGLGQRARYIRLSSGGPNALDFHIACYIGRLSVTEPESDFVIMSGDTGFDALITHLQSLQVRVRRTGGVMKKKEASKETTQRPTDAPAKAATPAVQTGKTIARPEARQGKTAAKRSVEAEGVAQWELLEQVQERLGRMKQDRPKSAKSFRSMFRELLEKQKSEDAADELLRVLEQRGAVRNENGKLTWDYRRSLRGELS
jgi:hypothetical protein